MIEAYSCARTFQTVAAAPSGAVVVASGVGENLIETSPSRDVIAFSMPRIIWSTPGAKRETVAVETVAVENDAIEARETVMFEFDIVATESV